MNRNSETIAPIGAIDFPFLPTQGHAQLFWGAYERENVAFLRKWLRPRDIFVDLGANVGYFSAVAADCVGSSGQVHAFEPEPNHFQRLKRLSDLNPQSTIIINNLAVSDIGGFVDLFVTDHAGWHTIIPGFVYDADFVGIVKVEAVKLDDYLTQVELKSRWPIRLVKIDVEGAESAVLRGAQHILRQKSVEAFLIETTPARGNQVMSSVGWLFELMRQSGYQGYRLASGRSGGWVRVESADIVEQTDILWVLSYS